MFDFIKKSFNELDHVVWPTKKETRTYMMYNVVIIIIMTIVLALLGYVFKTALEQTKLAVNPDSAVQYQQQLIQDAANSEANAAQQNLENFGVEIPSESIQIDSGNLSVESVDATTTNGETTTITTEEATPTTQDAEQNITETASGS